VWRALSPAFLHLGIPHLLFNMAALLSIGPLLEAVLGRRRFLLLYFASALGGQLASAAFHDVVGVGASGAIWGLMTAALAIATRPRGLLPEGPAVRLRSAGIRTVVINAAYSFVPGVDLFAHFGGGIVGALLVFAGVVTAGLVPLGERERAPRSAPALTAAAALACALAAASVAAALINGRPWEIAHPALTRVTLDGAGVSAEISRALFAFPPQSDGKTRSYQFGDLGQDPVVLRFVTVPLDSEVAQGDLERELEADEEGLRHEKLAGEPRAGNLKRVAVAGRPALVDEVVRADGTRIREWTSVFRDRLVILQLYLPPKARPEWSGIGERVFASVQRSP